MTRLRDPSLSFLPDGRLLVGEGGRTGWYVATTPGNTAFERIDSPEAFDVIEPAGDELIAIGTRAYVSADDGVTWKPVDDGS